LGNKKMGSSRFSRRVRICKKDEMAEPTYDEVLKASLNSKRLLYRQLISSFMIKFLCNAEVNFAPPQKIGAGVKPLFFS
ncbi:MAG: hypothetical protein MI862_24570, partial [Desulfobacterales bacterium]|nr:hypothetical protein [Desulfobacterales bacterium]